MGEGTCACGLSLSLSLLSLSLSHTLYLSLSHSHSLSLSLSLSFTLSISLLSLSLSLSSLSHLSLSSLSSLSPLSLSLSLSLSHIPVSASPRQSPLFPSISTPLYYLSLPYPLSLALSSFTSPLIVRIEIRLIMCSRVDFPGLIAPLLFHVKESERFDEGAGENKRPRLNTSKAGRKGSEEGTACENW